MKKIGIFILMFLISVLSFSETFTEKETRIKNGKTEIYGIRYIPDKKGKMPLVILSHELGGTHKNMERYAKALAEEGIVAYIFDFPGGSVDGRGSQSTGRKSTEMSVMTEVSDVEKIIEESKKWDYVDQNKIVLIGGSQGGVVSAFTASRNIDKVAGLVLMYPAFVMEDDIHNFAPTRDKIPQEFTMRGWIKVGAVYFKDAYDIDFMKEAAKYNKPVLILHGTLDPHVPVIKSEKLNASYPNSKLVLIEGAEHSFRDNDEHFNRAMAEINNYLKDNKLDQ
ncbi:alpha/beta fold hydrolase [Fusobacterium simiae]|uniref:alpha/beta hydrolase family protein n=1 Tax=Fusobacterium simiae TaxID=855 RepID=UPI0023509A11|nr:alpha/beta fold hydrolase [Fusobacterium simiae]MDC7954318.1 alpha/beta fold hydrolase [Fusobacterium simiae]